MLLVATACVLAGTWQIARLGQKVGANDELRTNAHAVTAPVENVLPLVAARHSPPGHQIQFRTITATGSYDEAHTGLVRQRSVGDDTGFLVLTPLRTSNGVLLVVRGFVADPASGAVPSTLPPPPTGQVSVTARLEPAEIRSDDATTLTGRQLESINPVQQSARLGAPVYAGYAELLPGQPGTAQLTAIPAPDLSNPAGGAVEPQHVAYIIQWYLFAVLALAAPFAMARAETRQRPEGDLDDESDGPAKAGAAEPSPAAEPTPAEQRAARLADRYGRAIR